MRSKVARETASVKITESITTTVPTTTTTEAKAEPTTAPEAEQVIVTTTAAEVVEDAETDTTTAATENPETGDNMQNVNVILCIVCLLGAAVCCSVVIFKKVND